MDIYRFITRVDEAVRIHVIGLSKRWKLGGMALFLLKLCCHEKEDPVSARL